MTEALQRQLANDEPKCANCQHWSGFIQAGYEGRGFIGTCQLIYKLVHESRIFWTTDLTVCSKWEKRHAQTEAETQ